MPSTANIASLPPLWPVILGGLHHTGTNHVPMNEGPKDGESGARLAVMRAEISTALDAGEAVAARQLLAARDLTRQRRLLDVAMRKLMESLESDPDFMRDDESKACYVVLMTLDASIKSRRLNGLAEICTEYVKLNESSFDPFGITDRRPDKRF